MSNNDEKNIVVNRGQPPTNPYGSGGGLPASRDGWTIGWGGKGGGEGGRAGTLSGSKRRRLRQQDKLRREREARQKAEAAALVQAQAHVNAIANAQAQARIQAEAQAHQEALAAEQARAAQAQAIARAEQARVAAYQQALETLPHAQASLKIELDKKYSNAIAALPAALAAQLQSTSYLAELAGPPLLDAILSQKTQINYLISQKSELSKSKGMTARSFANNDPREITTEQYKAILGSRSINAEQAYQIHQAWAQAYEDALASNLHAHATEHLGKRSKALSSQYAEQSISVDGEADRSAVKHLAEANRLWSVVAGPTAPSKELPSISDKAKAVAEKLFTRQASKVLGRALRHLALLHPTKVAYGEIGHSILVTAASEVGVAGDVDLDFIASRNGTVNVTHRLVLEEAAGELTTAWAKADGVTVGTQVRVRSFHYNASTHTYEFTRDGDIKPSLIWTPVVNPGNSSTAFPDVRPDTSPYSGTASSPVSSAVEDYPTYDIEEISDLILVFPSGSGLEPVYVMLKSPRYLPGVVSGMGGTADPNWESAASIGQGSPIPSEVADALRDKRYSEFRSLKRAIWTKMSKIPEVTEKMNQKNIELIQDGKSPIVSKAERKGRRVRYEIHHKIPIANGGNVYDIDNLVFTTPAKHDNIHSSLRQSEQNR